MNRRLSPTILAATTLWAILPGCSLLGTTATLSRDEIRIVVVATSGGG